MTFGEMAMNPKSYWLDGSASSSGQEHMVGSHLHPKFGDLCYFYMCVPVALNFPKKLSSQNQSTWWGLCRTKIHKKLGGTKAFDAQILPEAIEIKPTPLSWTAVQGLERILSQ